MGSDLRVVAIRYSIRPVGSVQQFAEQVVFPQYFTAQLLTLGDLRRPSPEQVSDLAVQDTVFIELMSGLARSHGL